MTINRRSFLTTAGLGLGSLLLPGAQLAAQTLLTATGFTHSVASGEPGPDSVLLWTRFVPIGRDAATVRVEVSDSANFRRIITGGQMTTGPWRDHTVKITVAGLTPGRTWFYRFVGPDGSLSPVGQTKSLPVGKVKQFRIATFSCANIGFGYFNAYAHAAQAAAHGDIDLVVFLGDYFYEYARGKFDMGAKFPRSLLAEPAGELLALADYRLRYAAYRNDPDLQALHQSCPWIPAVDDHEIANDSWEGGAENHKAEYGDWSMRKHAALQAWREWLPVGETPWQAYEIGDLATYLRTDTRIVGRTRPPEWDEIQRGDDIPGALRAFRDGAWQDPAATMLGSEQEVWLGHAFAAQRRLKKTWTVLGSGSNIGDIFLPPEALDWLKPGVHEKFRHFVVTGVAASQAGIPYYVDAWHGYPQARGRLLAAAQAADLNLIALTGDSHNAWAFDLKHQGRPVGVEFGGQSVTSPGLDLAFRGVDPAMITRNMLAANRGELRWMDPVNRGYMLLTLTPETASSEWVFMETLLQRSLATKSGQRMTLRRGKKQLEAL